MTNFSFSIRSSLAICLSLGAILGAHAEPEEAAKPVDFALQIAPIFKQHCHSCHGPKKQESEFRVDIRARLLQGGDLGQPAIVPGKSAESHLIKLVSGVDADFVMPPEGERLTGEQVTLLRAWIDQGAKMPEGEVAKMTTDHWSFQPVKRVEPTKHENDWVANEIDAFVLAKLNRAKLQTSPQANRVTLIRRLYLVMHGLPPTPEEVEQFVSDPHRDAYKVRIERVLNSPRYGERWAQHWLDVIRFGETHGFETNRERPNAWHYRDYVIQSLNDDKRYDQFIKEQLAGDATGADAATGYLVAGPHDLVKGQDPNYQLVQRQDELADMINTTGTAFLGLTLGCSRCHNHKFDPITQRDYYSIQAVFAGVQHADRELPRSKDAEEKFAAAKKHAETLRAEVQEWMADQGFRPAVSHLHNVEKFEPVEARVVRFTTQATNSSQPCIDELEIFASDKNVALAKLGAKARCSSALPGHEIHKLEHINDGKYGNGRSWISNEAGAGWVEIELPEVATIDRIEWARDREGRYKDRIATRYVIEAAVEPGKWKRIASSDDRLPYTPDQSIAAIKFDGIPEAKAKVGKELFAKLKAAEVERDRFSKTPTVYAGTFSQPGPTHRLYRGDPLAKREEVAPDALEVIGSLGLARNTPEQARRIALAEWIADPKNPLTARVMVNRIWQHHFGTGLVDTPSDFGKNGTLPSHPELLDWLADEFVNSGWSIKHIHKLILLSSTFQQDSAPRVNALGVDAASRLLWRFPPRRLEAEAIRDCILSASGVLDKRMGGPGFSGFEVELENVRHFFPKTSFGPEDWRRMVYMTKVRQERDAIFGAFDCPDLSQVMPKRSRSTTPLQALNLFNSHFMLQQAELLANRLEREGTDERNRQMNLAFRLCFGREPQGPELTGAISLAEEHGLVAICRALLNSNEFLFIP
jgi:mono/diheme cytochrome c family protein